MLTVYEYRANQTSQPMLVVRYHNAYFTVGTKQAGEGNSVGRSSELEEALATVERLTQQLKTAQLENRMLRDEYELRIERERERMRNMVRESFEREREALDLRYQLLDTAIGRTPHTDSHSQRTSPSPKLVRQVSSAGIDATHPPPLSRSASSVPSERWTTIPAEMKLNYDATFANTDTTGEGHITGEVARSLFMRSGLPVPTLAKVWSLAAVLKNPFLTKEEFAIAMHLINAARNGVELPPQLPPSLLHSVGLQPM